LNTPQKNQKTKNPAGRRKASKLVRSSKGWSNTQTQTHTNTQKTRCTTRKRACTVLCMWEQTQK